MSTFNPTLAEVLGGLFDSIKPKKYVEFGNELEYLARMYPKSAEQSYGIDWSPIIDFLQLDQSVHIFPVTADIALHNAYILHFLYEPDLVFVNGFHRYEEVAKILLLIEQYCKKDTILLTTDTWPSDPNKCARPRKRDDDKIEGVGDNFRILNMYSKYRPDLKLENYNVCDGLLKITNLNPENAKKCLKNYIEVITDALNVPLEKRETKYDVRVSIVKVNNTEAQENVGSGIHIS